MPTGKRGRLPDFATQFDASKGALPCTRYRTAPSIDKPLIACVLHYPRWKKAARCRCSSATRSEAKIPCTLQKLKAKRQRVFWRILRKHPILRSAYEPMRSITRKKRIFLVRMEAAQLYAWSLGPLPVIPESSTSVRANEPNN